MLTTVLTILRGVLAFSVPHLIEVAYWGWFKGHYRPWFTNSGRAATFTLGILFIVSMVTAAAAPRDRAIRDALWVALGAILAMTIALFSGDAGTIFPLVWIVCAGFLVASAALGGLLGRQLALKS
jgi:hypothetical protein